MNGTKKIAVPLDNTASAKIQRKFDTVFTNVPEKGDLSFSIDDQISLELTKGEQSGALSAATEVFKKPEEGPGFELELDEKPVDRGTSKTAQPSISLSMVPNEGDSSDGLVLDGLETEEGKDNDIGEFTQKTLIIDTSSFADSNENSEVHSEVHEVKKEEVDDKKRDKDFSLSLGSGDLSFEVPGTPSTPSNHTSSLESSLEPSLLSSEEGTKIKDLEDSKLMFTEDTPGKGFSLADLESSGENYLENLEDEATRLLTNLSLGDEEKVSFGEEKKFEEFSTGDEDPDLTEELTRVNLILPKENFLKEEFSAHEKKEEGLSSLRGLNSEDGLRFQSTIRALREEREDLLAQIKNLKMENKELKQEELTMKANLDEAKIEIGILRKRHAIELEDMKYKLAMGEEKKALAEERARQADVHKEKLEQKIRIEFNQVKQREKELENKLELLSMDVESQVQGRDQKILELRRKIDALEFNMENASIKEQKSLDDKRKMEDRLNKMMKTLRHSIKNIEEDMELEVEEDCQKEKS